LRPTLPSLLELVEVWYVNVFIGAKRHEQLPERNEVKGCSEDVKLAVRPVKKQGKRSYRAGYDRSDLAFDTIEPVTLVVTSPQRDFEGNLIVGQDVFCKGLVPEAWMS